ncbi:hypothetical protein [Allokutzneria oryzae]|uniref:Uncharacterized protein n=1 Tax=Allokutzneria oryzae TaxID=1378989 RepID=A0ABV6A5A8_9PSEU
MAGPVGSGPAAPGRTVMEIELDVFSGIPNPRWPLSPEEAERLVALLPTPLPSPPRSGALGYRGFVLHTADREFGLPATVHLGRPTGALATQLIAQATQHGYAHLIPT